MIILQNTCKFIVGLALFLVSPSSGNTQNLFEGYIYYKIGTDTSSTPDFFFAIKNGNAKTSGDIAAPLGKGGITTAYTLFISGREANAYVINTDSQKVKQLTPRYEKGGADTTLLKTLIKSNKKRVIAGINCTGYELKMEANDFFKAYIWLADDITVSGEFDLHFDVMISEYMVAGKLIMAFSMISGDTQSDMIRVLRVEKKEISDSEFQIPQGYKHEKLSVMAGIKTKWVFE
ncbi:hypothetical protein ESA94_03345 [Lacibacter luteus]|uniref:DUF4412 domain-containing protein n=1 Tax=Lacibacter luteus TaxID=2508719 RepID=A0A4Q1CN66_9BACT|nr:hypothetical protein [Lacibacter luteus]RXK62059.1 hypothetical protein ESA94_03345 [Lacibacter luteus]